MYIIYKTTCLLNGKIYIGQHKVKSKKTLDPWYIGSGYPKFDNALRKYGKENFKREIICTINVDDISLVNKIEVMFIKKYNSSNSDIGYNILDCSISSSENPMYDENIRRVVSRKNKKTMKEYFKTHEANFKGCKHSEETRKKMSDKRRKRSGVKGWKMTEEQRKRLSESHIGKQSKDKHPLWGKIFINNGNINKTIDKNKPIPEGWVQGLLRKKKIVK